MLVGFAFLSSSDFRAFVVSMGIPWTSQTIMDCCTCHHAVTLLRCWFCCDCATDNILFNFGNKKWKCQTSGNNFFRRISQQRGRDPTFTNRDWWTRTIMIFFDVMQHPAAVKRRVLFGPVGSHPALLFLWLLPLRCVVGCCFVARIWQLEKWKYLVWNIQWKPRTTFLDLQTFELQIIQV